MFGGGAEARLAGTQLVVGTGGLYFVGLWNMVGKYSYRDGIVEGVGVRGGHVEYDGETGPERWM